MAFAFEYWGLSSLPMPAVHWVNPRDQQWNLLGRLTEGRVALGDRVSLPTAYGPAFRGYVVRFAESFTEWLGLPFYDYLTADTMPDVFCLCVGNVPGEYRILCPGVARLADA
jgi:hypothetical protein